MDQIPRCRNRAVHIARRGIEMIEAPYDNALHRQFVGQVRLTRICSCCAWHEALRYLRRSFAARIFITRQATANNRCVCFDRDDRTGQSQGDKLLPCL